MPWRGSFDLTEACIAWAMDKEEGQKWPPERRLHPNSAVGAPNGQSGVKFELSLRGPLTRQALRKLGYP